MAKVFTLKHIETPRLILRPVRFGDELEINQAIHASIAELKPWMPWASDTSLSATRNFVETAAKAWNEQSAKNFPMAITLKESLKIIGISGYNEHSQPESGVYEIGYWLHKHYEGQGLASET